MRWLSALSFRESWKLSKGFWADEKLADAHPLGGFDNHPDPHPLLLRPQCHQIWLRSLALNHWVCTHPYHLALLHGGAPMERWEIRIRLWWEIHSSPTDRLHPPVHRCDLLQRANRFPLLGLRKIHQGGHRGEGGHARDPKDFPYWTAKEVRYEQWLCRYW